MKVTISDSQLKEMSDDMLYSVRQEACKQIKEQLPELIRQEIKNTINSYDSEFKKTREELKKRLVEDFTTQAIHWGAIGAGQALKDVVHGELGRGIERAIEKMRTAK